MGAGAVIWIEVSSPVTGKINTFHSEAVKQRGRAGGGETAFFFGLNTLLQESMKYPNIKELKKKKYMLDCSECRKA